MITVYGRATSSNVQAVMWGIAELGLDHERLDFGHVHGGLDTEHFGELNPHRRVPVLRDGGMVMWESGAILRYLGARYGAAPFWPADDRDRARVDMWAEWGKNTFAADFTSPIFRARVLTPARERDAVALGEAVARFDADLAVLEAQIGDGPFVLGPDFTLADITIGHVLFRYFTMKIPRRDRPGISAYYARLQDRPAFREHVMVSWEPLRVAGA